MSTEDEMTLDERRKYLRRMKKRYDRAHREERERLLDEMEAVTGLHRKSLIRLMNGSLERRPRRRQRGRTYGPEVEDALRVIAESLDYICAERLTPNLVWIAQHLADHGELTVSPQLLQQLDGISISTVQRILTRLRQDAPRLPRKGPERAQQARRGIPMKRIPWDETEPGDFEVDLVHHSGPSPAGLYVHTLQMMDVATSWSERVAVLGRGYCAMQDGFRRALARLPFPVREIHSDNGSEFFHHHLLRFWGQMVHNVQLSRSRPFHKNDNPFVEQKNATLVRAYLGHERLDTVAHTLVLNQLYDKMWLYYNFFQPVMRVREKRVIPAADGQPARPKRRYDSAGTPFDRLCQTKAIQQAQRERLEPLRDQTNPRTLRQEIYELIDYLFSLPLAVEGETENVLDTLTFPLSFYEKGADAPVTFSFD